MHIIQIIPANPGAYVVSIFDHSDPGSNKIEPLAFWALVDIQGEQAVIPCGYEIPAPELNAFSCAFSSLQQAEDYAQRSSAEILRKQGKK